MGSVIPVSILVRAADKKRLLTTFFDSSLALRYIAKAAPGKPNIIIIYSPEKYLVASTLKCFKFGSAS